VGFAIPSNTAAYVMQDLRESGRVRRGFIGAQLGDVTYESLRELKLPEEVVDGVVIEAVQEGGPAAKADLKKGDIVTKVDGRVITSVAGMRNAVAMVRPGKTLDLDVYRNGKPLQIRITVEEQTDQKLAAMSPTTTIEELKITVEPLNAALAKELDVDDIDSGLVVVAMERRGKAAQLGLRPGDIITEVNGKAVSQGAEMLEAIGSDTDRLLLKVRRGNSEMVLRLNQR
jgi:serine protease Do